MKKSKQTFLVAAFFLSSVTAIAQADFQKYYTYNSSFSINDIKSCSDGGFIAAAYNMLIKFNSAGDVTWTRLLSLSCTNCLNDFMIHSVGEIGGTGYVAMGVDNAMGTKTFFLMQTDLNGNLTWVKYFDMNNATQVYELSKLSLLPGGEFLLTGSFSTTIQLVKADADGNLIWSKSYQGNPSKCPGFESAILSNGTIITCYKDDSDLGIIATASSGALLWSKRFENNGDLYNRPYTMLQSHDGNILVAGLQTAAFAQGGPYRGFLMKMDTNGDILWNKIFDSPNFAGLWFYDLKQLPGSDILLTGITWEANTSHHIFIKTDNNGDIIYSKFFGNAPLPSSYFTFLKSDVIDGNNIVMAAESFVFKSNVSGNFACNAFEFPLTVSTNNLFLTNNVSSNIAELPGAVQVPGTATLYAVNVIAGDYCNFLGIEEAGHNSNSFSVFPNPVTDELSVSGYPLSGNGELGIYNLLGERVFESPISLLTPHISVNISHLKAGVYYVKVSSGEKAFTKRVVKM